MSAFNAFFAQLTGGGAAAGDAPPSATTAAAAAGGSADHRGNGTADGGGGGGGRADGAFGVPLTGAAVTYDPENDRSRFGNPQCTTVTTLPEVSRRRGLCKQGALVVANADFTCYGISSNIRVIHRPTGARALIKPPPHLGDAVPQDICLLGTTGTATANTASGLLACATSEGDVLIWELGLRASAPGVGAAASADKAVEVSTQLVAEFKGGGAQSVAWHTSGMRMLAVVSGSSVVISDCIGQQDQSAHLPGAVCKGHYKQITNASFSRGNGDVLATASEDGTVRVWDTRSTLLEATPSPQSIACLRAFRAAPEGSTLSRVLVVDSDMALVTGDEDNRLLKVWPAPESNGGAGAGAGALEGVLPSQVLSLPGWGALSLEVDPGGEFVFAAATEEGLLYALHLTEGGQKGIRMDYLRPYSLAHPVQSFTVLSKEPEPEYGYENSPPSAEDRILQLVCAQTKPVQIYRIAVRDALPPAGVFAKPADNGNDGGPADDDSKVGGDPPVSSAPEKVEEEEEEEEGVVVAAGVRRYNDDAEEEGDVDVGVVVDSVAVSKEGGVVGAGGESAPSFEKKLDMDITDEPLGLSPTGAAAVASSPPVLASPHPSPTSSDGGGSRSTRTRTSTSTSSADSSFVDEDRVLPATMASKPTAPISPGYVSSSVGTPSGVMLGDGAAGGGDANVGSSSSTTSTTTRTTAAGMDIRGEEAGGAAAATSAGGADSSPTAATAAVDGRNGKDSARAAAGGLGVTAKALTAAMADALSDTSSGVGGASAGGPSPVLDPSAALTSAAADVGGAFSSGVSKGEGTSSSSSDASKRGGIPSPMMLGESAAAAAAGGGEDRGGALWAAAVEAEIASAERSSSTTMPVAGGGGGEDRGDALWAAAVEAEIASAEMSSSTTMPAAAPRERVATEELRRFLAPGDVGGLGAAAGVTPSSPSAAVGEASGAAFAAAAAAAAAAAEAETETEEEEDDDGEGESSEDFGLEDGEQSVSVSVSEERQEVGATTTEEATSFAAAADGGGLGGGGGGGQATGGGGGMLYSSSGEESMGASRRQGGGEGVRSGGGGGGGGGWVGRGGEDGAGEPSASGSFGVAVASAHGDASGGSGSSAAAAAVPPSAMQQQQQMASTHRREADTSAGASPIPMVPRHHPLVAGSPSGENAGAAAQQQHEQQQPSSPPLPPPPTVEAVVAAVLDPTAGGEASRDGGAARSVGRPIPGVNVDESATQALRSLLMRGGNRGGGRSGGGGSASGEGEESRRWSSGEMAGGGGGGGSSTEGAGGIMQSVPLPRADAEGAGAGLARPPNPATDDTRLFLASLLENPNHNTRASSSRSAAGSVMSTSSSTSAALAVGGGPVVTLPPPALPPAGDAGGAGASILPAASLPGVVPALPEMRSVPSTSLSVGHTPRNAFVLPPPATSGGGDGGASLFSSTSMAEVTAGAPTGAPVVSGSRSVLVTPTAQAPPLAPPGMVPRRQQQQQQQPPRASRGFDAVDAGVGRAGAGAMAGGMDTEELIEAITARVNADMAARMSGLQSSLEQTVASCCRRTILASTASAEDTRANERAALVGDISSSVDRSVRRGMVEMVATPLAKLVVSTARQVVVDPLQASMSTMHGHQQRQQQALAAAAAAGAQAGVQSQAAGMATATARAQAGNVRRELLESREELSRDVSRAVASAVQEPVGVAFRECFEGQLIPRIQSAVQRMFEQINDSLTRGLQASPLVNNRAGALAEDVSHVRDRVEGLENGMRDVASALSGLGVKMERLAELTRAMQQTGLATAASVEAAAASAQAAAVAAAVSSGGTTATRSMSGRSSGNVTPPAAVDPREELHRLVGAGRVDDAMNRALSASDLPLVMWLCGRLDPVATPSTLPQHILLCLVQQFGASDLLEDTTAKLKWLQNCVLAIDPTEATIRAHLPVVLRQLKGALTTSTPIISQRGGTDVSVVRLTTHVVNSLASMLPPAGSEAVAL